MTDIRPELSKKNKYYLPKHRYYELKHFCLQYPIWKRAYDSLTGLSGRPLDLIKVAKTHNISDPTGQMVLVRQFYQDRIEMLQKAAKEVDYSDYIFKAVTTGASYTFFEMNADIPISRDRYYDAYRKFFWILNKVRE